MRILVTGVAGFIGAAVADSLLRRGDEVIGIDSLDPYYQVSLKQARIARLDELHATGFSFRKVDFSDRAALDQTLDGEQFDRIVHLGAQAGVRYSLENPHAYASANLVGHLNMLELARARQVDHLVYASSSSVYGGNEKVPFSVEDRVDHPVSLYAATKRADELMSESYASLYRLPQTGLRFFTVYGPWGRPDMMMWIFTGKILGGEAIPVFNGGELERDFTFIDDVVDGVLAALGRVPSDDGRPKPGGSNAPHAIYNLGNHRSERVLDVVRVLERACGREAVLKMLPMQPGDVERTFADIAASKRDLGFTPRVSVEEGVPAFVEWFRSYHGK